DVSKGIDKAAGAERKVVGRRVRLGDSTDYPTRGDSVFAGSETGNITTPATDAAKQWDGWGTALKPAFEPIVLARKPLAEKTVARNVLAHGTGAINVDACRIGTEDNLNGGRYSAPGPGEADGATYGAGISVRSKAGYVQPSGRWPANVLLDEHAAAWVDEQSGTLKSGDLKPYRNASEAEFTQVHIAERNVERKGDSGGASRFF